MQLPLKVLESFETIASYYEPTAHDEIIVLLTAKYEKKLWVPESLQGFMESQLLAHQRRVATGIAGKIDYLKFALDPSNSPAQSRIPAKVSPAAITQMLYDGRWD